MGEYNLRRLTFDEAEEMLDGLVKIRPLGKEYNKTADALRHHFGQDDGYDRGVYVVEKDGALLLWATSLETEEYVVIGSMGTKDP